jgi:hypothetical protein
MVVALLGVLQFIHVVSEAVNGGVFAQSGPDEPAFTLSVQSTMDNRWLALARSVKHSTILSDPESGARGRIAVKAPRRSLPAWAWRG